MMRKLKARLIALARFGLLLALVALGVALVVSAALNRREAERLSALLDRSQAERFFRPIPQLHDRNRGAASREELVQVLEQFRGEGLRYLAELAPDGSVLAEAGESVSDDAAAASTEPHVVGDRVRMMFRPPRGMTGGPREHQPPPPPREPGFERPPLEPPPGSAAGPGGRGPGAGRSLPDLLLEFEPTVSNQLRTRANESFGFSLTAAISLLALTAGLWLSQQREARQRERQERQRQLAVLGEMSAVLAHEIRNPLASLKGTAQLLGEQLESTSPLQKKVTRIVDESKRLEELSSTLLDLVRSSAVSPKPLDPAAFVRDVAQSFGSERVVVDATNAPSSWELDAPRMEQVLKNLIQNALQAAPDVDSQVDVSVSLSRGKLMIEVRDRGPGIPAGSEEKVFEAFHTTRTQGTGLGLAVARRIVELHGGQLRAGSHPEGGAVLSLVIPRA